MFSRALLAFYRDERANIAIMFGMLALPLTFAMGLAIDYTTAARRKSMMDAIADSAVLAAITPAMMRQSDAQAIAAARNMFNAQAGRVSGVVYTPANVTVTATTTGLTRTVSVSYTASAQNAFGGILGRDTFALGGTAQGSASAAPNMDFYLLLDTSPSMAIAATTSGISTMVSNTQSQGGCAFACHQSNPSRDNLGNPGGIDNYQLARNLGVELRIDRVRRAAQDVATTAQAVASSTGATYRMAIYTFDVAFNAIRTLTSDLSNAHQSATNVQMLTVYSNNWLTSTNSNSDTDTAYYLAMDRITTAIPTPGNGTTATGDSPQAVLFFVTDGVQDEMVGGRRQQSVMDPAYCEQLKRRGVRIAVVYTTYLPLPTNSWYNSYIAPFQPQIGPTLRRCASDDLFFEVTTDGDIAGALVTLFQRAVASAHLTR